MDARRAAAELGAWLAETREWVEGELTRAVRGQGREGPCAAPRLEEAMAYAVLGGGKRLRAALVRLACEWTGGRREDCAPPAAAVELLHAYSLVHDDLPCMDDDDWRRGKPSCHAVYGEWLAVLAGDALQARAFEVLAQGGDAPRAAEWVRVLARAAGARGMVGGQALDMEAPSAACDAGAVRAMHAGKTAALIAACCELGGIASGADAAARERLARFGRALGLAFQAIDDVLDVEGDKATLGKTPGKDAEKGKLTLVAALGLAGTRSEAARLAAEARAVAAELGAREGDLALRLVDHLLERRA